jgi:soluble lytic murein transglycosylase-like protein
MSDTSGNESTARSMATEYPHEIALAALAHSLDPKLVTAVVLQESSGNTDAFRYEPAFFERYLAHKPEYAGKPRRRVSSSYGLMQIMYSTARQHGYTGDPETLFLPACGLEYGCRHLRLLLNTHGDVEAALSAYNAGSPDSPKGRQYAAKVLAKMKAIA